MKLMTSFYHCIIFLLVTSSLLCAQDTETIPKGDAHFWFGVINNGSKMPLETGYKANQAGNNYGNQIQPLILSDKGIYIWSEEPISLEVQKEQLVISSTGELKKEASSNSLRGAFLKASATFFPPSGKMPADILFTKPQYNTWIELMYNQNQEDVLKYARAIIDNGFPPGVLMIDDNWQEDYGKWDFHAKRFPNPKAMMKELHELGFEVMLWVCPFVSPDCDEFRKLEKQKSLMRKKDGSTAIVPWWNGYSGCLDLSDPKGVEWFKSQLDFLQETYGVEGFKFDAGDTYFYKDLSSKELLSANEHTALFARIGLDYPLNEYRACWKLGGQPLAQRLCDKAHNWQDLQTLVPNMILEGLMGYSFSCPDLIGGGEFSSFLSAETIDQELIVRSTQCSALMPMMQFSVAPWRILDAEHFQAVKKAVALREQYEDMILALAKESALTGEPILRPLEYVFPHQGYAKIKDQFMMGDQLMVAPVTEKGKRKRKVVFPKGRWKTPQGEYIDGGKTLTFEVPLDELLYFEKQ